MTMTALSDAGLLDQVRNGDRAAYTELYVRHQDAARRLACSYRRAGDPDDLVNSAFERVLRAIRRGRGPTDAFRAYLFVTLRRLAVRQAAHGRDEPLDDVPEPVLALARSPELDHSEREIVAQAFSSLPGRWQAVLWHSAVEGRQPREFAGAVGLTPNAAAALAYRARERLRQAYLQAHLQASSRPACEPHRSRLGSYVRDGLSRRERTATRQHLDTCEACRQLVGELDDVNRLLVRSVMPVFMLASGAKLSAVAGAGAGAGAGAAGAAAPAVADLATSTWSRLRDVGPVATGALAAAVAALTLGVALLPHVRDGDRDPSTRWETGRGPAGAPVTTAPDDEAAEPLPDIALPATPTPLPAEDSATAPADGGGDSLLSADVDLDLLDGVAGADVQADVDLDLSQGQVGADLGAGLDLAWVAGVMGQGTLEVVVPNDRAETLSGARIDVRLTGEARITSLLSTGCSTSAESLIGGLIDWLQSAHCALGDVSPGSSATVQLPAHVSADGASATVSLVVGDEVVSTVSSALPAG